MKLFTLQYYENWGNEYYPNYECELHGFEVDINPDYVVSIRSHGEHEVKKNLYLSNEFTRREEVYIVHLDQGQGMEYPVSRTCAEQLKWAMNHAT